MDESKFDVMVMIMFIISVLSIVGFGFIYVMNPENNQIIYTSASSKLESEPDTVEMMFGVETEGLEASDAQQENTNKMNRIIDALKRFGVKDIETSNYNIYPYTKCTYDVGIANPASVYCIEQGYKSVIDPSTSIGYCVMKDGSRIEEWEFYYKYHPTYVSSSPSMMPCKEVTMYKVSNIISVKSGDIDSAGDVIDIAVENGANTINGVWFTLTDDKQDALRTQVIEKAVFQTRKEAESAARAVGKSITGVKDINIGSYYFNVYRDMKYEGVPAIAATTLIEPGDVSVTASVTVSYIIT